MQTLGQIKKKIYMALDVYSYNGEAAVFTGNSLEDTEIKINSVIDSVLRKIVVITKALVKIAEVYPVHSENPEYDYLPLPEDFMSLENIKFKNKRNFRGEYYISAKNLISSKLEKGSYTLIYYAFPEKIDESTNDDLKIPFDDYILDTAVSGAAMELCRYLYPDDNVKYIRLATEYDERMANMYQKSIRSSVSVDTLFSLEKRGIL